MSFWDFIATAESGRLIAIAAVAGLIAVGAVATIAVAVHCFIRYPSKKRRDLIKLVRVLVKALRG